MKVRDDASFRRFDFDFSQDTLSQPKMRSVLYGVSAPPLTSEMCNGALVHMRTTYGCSMVQAAA